MGMSHIKRPFILAILIAIACVALTATVSATTMDFGKSNLILPQKVGISLFSGNAGNDDVMKAGLFKSYTASYTLIKPQASAPYYRKTSSYSPVSYYGYQTTVPVTYPTITPVPEQSYSNSTLGGLVIRGPEGDWINMRSNFYNPSMVIYDGRWHYHVGTLPAYWENMALPGSYSIQIANKDTGLVYYCETVMVYPGQTTYVQVYNTMCPICSCT